MSRKKLKSTSRYIYQTLFLNGENSDIRICALGQEWNLHKVYLCQVKHKYKNTIKTVSDIFCHVFHLILFLSVSLFSLPPSHILQSGYFSSMFSGSWKESNMMEINLEIPDQNIDTEGERTSSNRKLQSQTVFVLFVLLIELYCFVCVCVSV